MGAVRKVQASLPRITFKGQPIGVNSVVGAVKVAAAQVAKPIEVAAAGAVAVVASTLTGLPITPKMVDQFATEIKVNTYDKPRPPQTVAATPAPVLATIGAPTLADKVQGTIASAPAWRKALAVLAVAAGAAYFMRGKK